MSAAIGGDPTVRDPSSNPVGYTTKDGVVSRGKSTVMIWYLGSPPPTSLFGSAHVYATSLGAYNLNAWNTYTIDVTAAA